MTYKVMCLYCGIVTGTSFDVGRTTVCVECRWSSARSELREVIAGQRPWARPLSSWANRDGALPDDEASKAQTAWDTWQNWVRVFNAAHLGCSCSAQERVNGHKRELDCLPECFAPQREAALAALQSEDRTAYDDYRMNLGLTWPGHGEIDTNRSPEVASK